MARILVVVALLSASPAIPILPVSSAAFAQNTAPQCADTPEKKAKRSMFGNILGGIAGGLLGSAGGNAGSVVALALPATSYLTDELLKMLDCKEQQQAAKATDQAIRGGVGSEVQWKSETRSNVRGSSKVTGEQKLADGSQCMTVTDVVIVEGEETTVPKTMCRAPGQSGYVKV